MNSFSGVDTTKLLVSAMKTAEMNHRHLANNIANADTPGFNPTNLNFQKTLAAVVADRESISLRNGGSRHLAFKRDTVELEDVAYLSKNDYNKVDLDDQLARLQENTGSYTMYASLLSKRFQTVKNMLNALAR